MTKSIMKGRITLLLKHLLIFQYRPPIFNNCYIPQWGCHFKDQGCLRYEENKQLTRRKKKDAISHNLIQSKEK